MTLMSRIADLITAVGADYKAVATSVGALANLTTSAKTDLVSAINELVTSVASNTSNASIGPWVPITLNATYFTNATGYRTPAYRLENGGKNIRFRGVGSCTTAAATAVVMFTLPPEARPDANVILVSQSSGIIGYLVTTSNGQVSIKSAIAVGSNNLIFDHLTYAIS